MTAETRPLRIAYLLASPPSYSETFIESEIRAVRAAGAAAEVFVARSGAESRSVEATALMGALARHPIRMAADVRRLGTSYAPRGLLAGAYAIRLAADVRRFRPDVIHTHFVNLPTAIAVLVGRELGTPVTAMAHAADFLLDQNVGALKRRLRRLDHLFVISTATAQQLAEKGVDMSAVPHSVVRAAFDGQLTDRELQPSSHHIRVVTVARLVAKKGIDTGIEAVGRLVAAGHQVRYDVYGDGPLRGHLEGLAERLGVAEAVRFHGVVSHARATAALAEADVAVLPCRPAPNGDLDGIPVFLMEAAGRGTPVVTTAVSGIPELVGDDGGWVVRPDAPEALAAAITQVIGDYREAQRRTAALRSRIRIEYSPNLQAERLLATWRRLATPGAVRGPATPTRP